MCGGIHFEPSNDLPTHLVYDLKCSSSALGMCVKVCVDVLCECTVHACIPVPTSCVNLWTVICCVYVCGVSSVMHIVGSHLLQTLTLSCRWGWKPDQNPFKLSSEGSRPDL